MSLVLIWPSAAPAAEIQRLELETNALIYSPASNQIYASVPSFGGEFGNRIVAIDPNSRTVVNSVFVGSEPGPLALSDDEHVLYVGLNGAGAIRRVEVPALTAGAQFSLGVDRDGARLADDIAVQPGNSNVVAVSLRRTSLSPGFAGLAVFDKGVPRPEMIDGFRGSIANRIAFGADPSTLFGFNSQNTEFGLRKLEVSATGVREVALFPPFVTTFRQDIAFAAGRLFVSNGVVIDPEAPALLGTFQTAGTSFDVDGSALLASFLNVRLTDVHAIQTFDVSTFLPVEQIPVPVDTDTSSLQRLPGKAFVFRTLDGNVVFVNPETSSGPAGAAPMTPISPLPPAIPQIGEGQGASAPFAASEKSNAFRDEAGRVVQRTAARGTTRFWYDAAGRRRLELDAQGVLHRYDEQGRAIELQ